MRLSVGIEDIADLLGDANRPWVNYREQTRKHPKTVGLGASASARPRYSKWYGSALTRVTDGAVGHRVAAGRADLGVDQRDTER